MNGDSRISDADFRFAFGKAVTQRRTALGMSQRAFARMSGIENSHLRDIEAGRRNLMASTMLKLASALGVSLSALIADAEERASSS